MCRIIILTWRWVAFDNKIVREYEHSALARHTVPNVINVDSAFGEERDENCRWGVDCAIVLNGYPTIAARKFVDGVSTRSSHS